MSGWKWGFLWLGIFFVVGFLFDGWIRERFRGFESRIIGRRGNGLVVSFLFCL